MPYLPPTDAVVAIAVADLHLGDKAPVARSAEVSWEEAQIRPLKQLCKYQERYDVPVLIAGDLFDRHNPAPWVVNMALKHLPQRCYAVPGQHDLPHHNYSDIRKSAYWTLVAAHRITHLEPGRPVETMSKGTPIRLHGFPFGVPCRPLESPHAMYMEICLVHDYLWNREENAYKDAPEVKKLSNRFAQFKGFDAVISGDNHRGWWAGRAPLYCNCGAFQRRKSDERPYDAMVNLICADGTLKRKRLDTKDEQWIDNAEDAERVMGGTCTEFIKELEQLGDAALDYGAAVQRRMLGLPADVQEVVKRCLAGGGK